MVCDGVAPGAWTSFGKGIDEVIQYDGSIPSVDALSTKKCETLSVVPQFFSRCIIPD